MLEKTPESPLDGKEIKSGDQGRRRRARQRMRQLDGITDSMNIRFEQALGVGDGQGSLACCGPFSRIVVHWVHSLATSE